MSITEKPNNQKGQDMKTIIRYTTAPETYDGFGTKTLEKDLTALKSDPRKTVRKVEIPESAQTWQETRYSSGLHLCMSEEDVREIGNALFETEISV